MNVKQQAEEWTKQLFTNGQGEHATRLKLVDENGRDLGGWGFVAVATRFERALKAAIKAERESIVRSIQARGDS